MTDPVDADALRAKVNLDADTDAEFGRKVIILQRAAMRAADEVDRLRDRAADDARDRERLRVDFNARAAEASRLRAVIENAPHAYGNSGYWCTADLEDAPCTCWKADAL